MSEIVDGLERKGLLARMRDQRDRRRTLVWLTEEGRAAMETERQVLCAQRLARAFGRLEGALAAQLLGGLRALVDAGDALPKQDPIDPRPMRKSKPEPRRLR
jgi:DNA-binding MarR family transcriptional regulator